MKTKLYNPSLLEVELAKAIEELQEEIQERLVGNKITRMENHIGEDNPLVKLFVEDEDGDPHEIVLKIIQVADRF